MCDGFLYITRADVHGHINTLPLPLLGFQLPRRSRAARRPDVSGRHTDAAEVVAPWRLGPVFIDLISAETDLW